MGADGAFDTAKIPYRHSPHEEGAPEGSNLVLSLQDRQVNLCPELIESFVHCHVGSVQQDVQPSNLGVYHGLETNSLVHELATR